MTTAVKRACDACHRRKVKCDGINPCRNCSASQLSCTYNAIPQKKGPKGSRAKVITELRENQRQTSLSAKVQNRINGMNGPSIIPSLAPTPGLLSNEMARECTDFFFANMYQSMPILHRGRLEQQALYMDQSIDAYCLLTSLSAFMMLQPGMAMPSGDPYGFDMPGASSIVSSSLLLEETIRVRKGSDYLDSPSLNSLCTSYFLFGCYYGIDMHDKAWFHLREATTLAHMIGMNKESTYLQYDGIEASRRRRLYWLLFVTERAFALQRNRPLTLEASINMPAPNDDPTDPNPHQLRGFIHQVNMFRSFDNVLVPLWNKTRESCLPSYLSALQKQIQDILPPYLNDVQSQLAEIQINQQWLKNTTWQLSVASGNASESGPYPYPVDIARDLLPIVSHLPGNLGLNGIALVEKLLSVTCALTEVLEMQPASRNPFTVGPREHLHQILNLLTILRGGDLRFLPLLLSKVHDALPRLADPMLKNAPENSSCNIDIFDGFGNAGMAQPCGYPSEEYDNKYTIARIDDMNTDSGSSNGGPSSNNDMSSPFASSPSVVSPGIEIPNGLPPDFNAMPDMVLSPMSHGPPPSMSPGGMNSQQGQHMHHSQQPQHSQHPQHPQHAQHPQHSQHHQHPQHTPLSPFPSLTSQMQGLNPGNLSPQPNIGLTSQMHLSQGLGTGMSHGLNNGLGQGINNNNMMVRPQPQRTNSFALGAAQIRTVGDFQALQRSNTDMDTMGSLGLNSIGTELDFNTLPR
ncbi:fungal-specific transcription factor domain-containing protein [Podospora appendiculata]|uniref:Fungal-specific transcription factor domain-containing protein n=1 Tax=Podospora appendiculata TaxID=314037 RepID=A0AAE1CAC9_9PEZI|nr:fungal-specific transcription factor domain-containing protein [Podospora appendiculata]